MIYQLLKGVSLYPNMGMQEPGIYNFYLEINQDTVFINNSANPANYQAYCLPWRQDTGMSIELPRLNPDAVFFFTPILTGCCIGVQNTGANSIKIIHANDFSGHMPQEILESYGGGVTWLITQHLADEWREKYHYTPMMSVYPDAVNKGTVFWGEFDIESDQWKFYYQDDNNVIHTFNY